MLILFDPDHGSPAFIAVNTHSCVNSSLFLSAMPISPPFAVILKHASGCSLNQLQVINCMFTFLTLSRNAYLMNSSMPLNSPGVGIFQPTWAVRPLLATLISSHRQTLVCLRGRVYEEYFVGDFCNCEQTSHGCSNKQQHNV